MAEIEKLKGCPFCGNDPEIYQKGKNGIVIKCKKCNLISEQKVLRYSVDWLREKMTEWWNKRIS